MKTLTKILILVLAFALSLCGFAGCGSDKKNETVETYTITFVQEGQDNVVKTVNKGATLTDIPTPVAVTGYEIVWDVTDFSDIQSDMTVTAVATPIYTITFVQEGQENVIRTAKKGTALTDIPTPVAVTGYEIVWDVTDFSDIQSDMTVTAVKTALTCTVTFVQEGQDNVVRTVNKGATLTDIPTPVAVSGYEIVWDVTDFTNIQSDMTVTAVATPVYTITFVQEGQENVIRTAKKGTALTDIPTPVAVTGYDVVWDVTDFSDIQSNMTVTAVKTAKTFTIYYVVSDFAEGKGVTLSQTQQTVTY